MRPRNLWIALGMAGCMFWASAAVADDERDLVRHPQRTALDDEFTQLIYVKTTDYGATWTNLQRAGDLTDFAPTEFNLPDMSACVTTSNELCYAVYLQNAEVPGVYSLTGPDFAPVLVMAEGANDFGNVGSFGSGWTDIGRTPNGDLFVIIWGMNAQGYTTFWGAKSTDSGVTWLTPFVIATGPTLPTEASSPHIADMNSDSWCFVLYEDDGLNYDQYLLRFPPAGGAGTLINLSQTSGSNVSYYTGNCKPIAYDPAADALYVVFRNSDVSGTQVGYSGNQGQSFIWQTIPGTQRYPSIALRTADQTPFVISNPGVPAENVLHWAWYAYDEFGYGGGGWTDQDTMVILSQPYNNGTGPLIYMNQAYFWDATHGVGMHNVWCMFTPESLMTSRTTDGGITWTDFTTRWGFITDLIDPGTLNNNEIVGGTNGVAYVISAGHIMDPGPWHFDPVDTTAATYPVIVEDAWWPDGGFALYDEVGVYDDELCVGAARYTGTWPLAVICWGADSTHDGFVVGDSMSFRLWRYNWGEEFPATPTFTVGDGTFGFGAETHVILVPITPPGDISVSPTTYNFGNVPVGATRTVNVWIGNVGEDTLVVFDIASNNNLFTLSPPFTQPRILLPGEGFSQGISFTSLDILLHQALISISSDDPDEPLVNVSLQAHGIARSPLPFLLFSPVDGDTVIGSNAALHWQQSVDLDSQYAMHYDVWLDTLAGFSAPWQVRDSITTNAATLVGLPVNHTYYWTVRATDNNTPGTWAADTFRFVYNPTDAAGDPNPELPRVFELGACYPNPFNPTTTVPFAVPRAGQVTLSLYDLSGRLVQTLADAMYEPGRHTMPLDGRLLPTGLYFVRMQSPGFITTQKVMLLR